MCLWVFGGVFRWSEKIEGVDGLKREIFREVRKRGVGGGLTVTSSTHKQHLYHQLLNDISSLAGSNKDL